jgi:cytochrome c-type biogenesis protein CcmH/NrfF
MLACALMSSGDYGMFVSIEPGGYGTIWLLWSGRPAGMGR